jgi:hypothetical protein
MPAPREENPGRLAQKGLSPSPVRLRIRMSAEAKEFSVISSAKPVFGPGGKVAMVISVLHDVTELREAELKLQQSRKMGTEFINKPFSAQALRHRVQQALG